MTLRRVTLPLLGAIVASLAFAQAPEPQPQSFLRKVIEFGDDKLAALEKGEVVTRQLPGADKPEIAAFGVTKVAGTRGLFVEKVRDIQHFRKVPQVPEIGVFSSPAKPEDLAALTLEEGDFDVMRKCEIGRASCRERVSYSV